MIAGISKYQFNRVPFGLAQAPAYFQTLINKVLDNIDFAMGYLDDIIIFSRSEEEHLDHIEQVLQVTGGSRTQTQPREMQFLQEAHPIPRSLTLRGRYSTAT